MVIVADCKNALKAVKLFSVDRDAIGIPMRQKTDSVH